MKVEQHVSMSLWLYALDYILILKLEGIEMASPGRVEIRRPSFPSCMTANQYIAHNNFAEQVTVDGHVRLACFHMAQPKENICLSQMKQESTH